MLAHAYTFFLDGYETTSAVFTFALYSVAENPEVQKKIMNEIQMITSKHSGMLTYEDLNQMAYLDNVLSGKQ